jgi:hypothetical protein
MEDFTALAATLAASVGDVRGCLVLSRDGLVLGAYPEGGDSSVKPAWLRFASLGEPERGFVQFGVEAWCYVRRGPYAAFATTGISVRPGLVIDQMEMVLLAAEETRARREGLRGPEPATATPATAAPSGRPRTPLHAETRPVDVPVVIDVKAAASSAEASSLGASRLPAPPASDDAASPVGPGAAGAADVTVEAPSIPVGSVAPQPGLQAPRAPLGAPGAATPEPEGVSGTASDEGSGGDEKNEDEVDRVMLAREFSQLLQEKPRGVDG